ncbi:MAG TPA: 7TM domain-containing protein [Candidatus Omnitrophota bacterium]|nr:7TM domain-containing protein [Candidatus Omnitrophota bacterium]
MNRRVYLLAFFLTALAAALISIKVIHGGQAVSYTPANHLWRVNMILNVTGQGARAKVRMTLPKKTPRQIIYNEHFEDAQMSFSITDRAVTGNRMGYWRSELLDDTRSIQYSFSTQLTSEEFFIPEDLELPKDPVAFYPQDLQPWLNASELIQSTDPKVKKLLKKIIGKDKKTYLVLRRIFNFIRGEVKYQSEIGSKDAKETLDKLVADCGGQARLFIALSRAAGMPSRMVGGLIMNESVKNITHVWAENYIDGVWVPFDTTNNYFAYIPNHYLELYRGDTALIRYLGLSKLEYLFSIRKEKMPPVDNPWSLYVLPVHFQASVKFLLLIPIGALVVSFFRTIVGVATFGTFAPILLAMAFREISLGMGLLCLGVVIFFGWILRKILDALKILVIPRLSIIVTMVIMFIMVMNVVAFNFGHQNILYITLFPMIIITWTIERLSVIQIEDGTKAAFKAGLGTISVSVAAYYVMGIRELHTYLFAFPELLLVVMALLLLLGRYTGFRLLELWRFREFKKIQRRDIL